MMLFYDDLKADLKRYSLNLVKAIEDDDESNIDVYQKWIKDTREILSDLNDVNMDIKDFVGLLAEKYGFVRAEAKN